MRNTKHITTGAITLGITSLLVLLDRISAGLFMGVLAIPLIIYGFYYPFKNAIVVAVSSVLMSFVLTGYLPIIITVAGYSLIGLSLIYARNKGFSNKLTYLIMYIASLPVYWIMIQFFGEYFGLTYQANYEFIESMAHSKLSPENIKTAVILFIAITPLMEAFIMKVGSSLILHKLTQSKKFKSNGKGY